MRNKETVIFIHGAWATPMCWRYFAPRITSRGFHTLAPAWPCKERTVANQLQQADPRLAKMGIPEIVEHFKALIRKQARPPILIGHSFGGLIVQILLDQGYGAAGIAINSIPPRGVAPLRLFSRQSLKKLRILFKTPCSWRKILPPPELDREQQALRDAQGLQTHLVPESGRIFWQLFSSAAAVDFRNHDRAPLLLVACGQDRCVPAETQWRNQAKYHDSHARTDFAFFRDLTHMSIAEPGFETLAAYCAAWMDARLTEFDGRAHADLSPSIQNYPKYTHNPQPAHCVGPG